MHKHFRVTSDEGLRLKSENVIVGRRKKANMEYINRGKRTKVLTQRARATRSPPKR